LREERKEKIDESTLAGLYEPVGRRDGREDLEENRRGKKGKTTRKERGRKAKAGRRAERGRERILVAVGRRGDLKRVYINASVTFFCFYLAYLAVHSRETRMASCSFSFQCAATSFARGSSCEVARKSHQYMSLRTEGGEGRRERRNAPGWAHSATLESRARPFGFEEPATTCP
jgi:hypothetical protein